MLKQKTHIELEKNDKMHSYICESGATLSEVFEVLSSMRSYIYGRIKEIEEAEAKLKESPIDESSKES